MKKKQDNKPKVSEDLKETFIKNIKKIKEQESVKEKKSESKKPAEDNDLQKKLQESQKNYLYLQADFDNFKKQSFKEKQEVAQYASEAFLTSFIENVLDDLERALETNIKNQNSEEFQKGIEMIFKKLQETFKKFNIEAIDPHGKIFDPSYQEALSREKTSQTPAGHVCKTFKKAYKLKGKVIRPAQVVVAEDPEEQA